jgi:hypothetical protein
MIEDHALQKSEFFPLQTPDVPAMNAAMPVRGNSVRPFFLSLCHTIFPWFSA